MIRSASPVLVLTFALLAGSCDDAAQGPAEQGDTAAGEVLGGSISDAMIPLEQLESQAPLAPPRAAAAPDLDAEQPLVTTVAGVDGGAANAADETQPQDRGAEAAPAVPAPDPVPGD